MVEKQTKTHPFLVLGVLFTLSRLKYYTVPQSLHKERKVKNREIGNTRVIYDRVLAHSETTKIA
jgi:hypothetical protein